MLRFWELDEKFDTTPTRRRDTSIHYEAQFSLSF